MLSRLSFRLAPVALFAALVLLQPRAESCAPAFRAGQSVRIASETALIIWDAKAPRDGKKGTEHFIRRGNFDTAAPDFGFLVPTPTKPEIAEANDEIFNTLEKMTPPKIVERRIAVRPPAFGSKSVAIGMAAPRAAVEVVGQGRVGSLDYAILRSVDKQRKPVLDWMAKNGYSTREALDEWLQPYLDKGWYLTAFKFATLDRSRLGIATRAVRMTFGTDQPFYPYREPADMREGAHGARLLRLYVLADERVQGTLGPDQSWSGRVVWSDHLDGGEVKRNLLDELKVDVARGEAEWSPRLNMFEDNAAPRYGIDEVYFSRSGDQGPVYRIEYRDVYGAPPDAAVPDETRALLVTGTSAVAGGLLLGLAGIALYFYLSGRAAPQR